MPDSVLTWSIWRLFIHLQYIFVYLKDLPNKNINLTIYIIIETFNLYFIIIHYNFKRASETLYLKQEMTRLLEQWVNRKQTLLRDLWWNKKQKQKCGKWWRFPGKEEAKVLLGDLVSR